MRFRHISAKIQPKSLVIVGSILGEVKKF